MDVVREGCSGVAGRRRRGGALFFLLLLLAAAPGLGAEELSPVARQGRGLLLEQDGQRLLVLRGGPYEMGYQHGVLLREDVRRLVDTALMLAFARHPGKLEEAWARGRAFVPARHLEEMRGLAAGAGVDPEKIFLANTFPELFHCSGLAVFGAASGDGRLLHARVLDYMTEVGLQSLAVTKLFVPDGRRPFISAGFAGFVGTVTGMNADQVALGEMGGGMFGHWDGVPMAFLMRRVLEESADLEAALEIFRRGPRTNEFYYLVSSGREGDARGLHCTPDDFVVLEPGGAHPALDPPPPADTVLMSAGNRYRALHERVSAHYGEITAETVKEIIRRPVAMESNLHNAVFAPAEGLMWLAVAGAPGEENFQACCQPYVAYDLPALLAAVERDAAAGHADGVLAADRFRPAAPEADPALAERLEWFDFTPADTYWTLAPEGEQPDFTQSVLRFRSPVASGYPENDLVYAEYYRSRLGEEPRPAVILLDIAQADLMVARLVGWRLAGWGVNALVVGLPYTGVRRPRTGEADLVGDIEVLRAGVRQAVADIRTAAAWLAERPENDPGRIGICGVSLGGIVGALAAGVDGGFDRGAFVLAGGDLAAILDAGAPETRRLRRAIDQAGIDRETLAGLLEPLNPLTYASRLAQTPVLMVNTRDDETVPAAAAQAFYEALPAAEITWYPGDHRGLLPHVFEVLDALGAHFSGGARPVAD